jgi:hypothetical protein
MLLNSDIVSEVDVLGSQKIYVPTWEERNSGRRVLDSLPPFPRRPKQYLESERAVGHIKKNF